MGEQFDVESLLKPIKETTSLREDEDWPDDYTPVEGRYSSKWPEDWDKETIAKEAEESVKHYVDDWGWELHKYARLNNTARVRKVLRYEIHLEQYDGYGKAKEVLNWQDEDFGQCALWWLAMHGTLGTLTKLIDAGADVNLSDKDGWTPLSVAAFYGHVDVVKALLASGADPSKQVEDGDTAYDKAVAWDHPDCAALLKGALLLSRSLATLHGRPSANPTFYSLSCTARRTKSRPAAHDFSMCLLSFRAQACRSTVVFFVYRNHHSLVQQRPPTLLSALTSI